MEYYLRKHYDFFYVRKEVDEFQLLHFICLKKEKNLVKGSVVVMIPFNNFITIKDIFEIKDKNVFDNLEKANTNEKIGHKIISIVEKNVNWTDLYNKCKNIKEKDKNVTIEER